MSSQSAYKVAVGQPVAGTMAMSLDSGGIAQPASATNPIPVAIDGSIVVTDVAIAVGVTSTETVVTIGATGQATLIAPNAAARSNLVQNIGSGDLTLGFGSVPTVGNGVNIPPGGAYSEDGNAVTTNGIYGASTAGTKVAIVAGV